MSVTYRELPAHPALRPWVACYWVLESHAAEPTPELLVPDGRPELIVHYGAVPRRLEESAVPEHRSFLFGQLSRPLRIEMPARAGLVAARLEPAGAHALAAREIEQLANRPVALDEAWGARGRRLETRVREATSWRERVELLERALLARLDVLPERDPAVDGALDTIARTGGAVPVAALASESGLTVRSLQRRFKRRVGLTPKTFSRVTRLQTVLTLARRDRSADSGPDWADIAAAAGYADQAHLIHDFKSLCGETPARWADRSHRLYDLLLAGAGA